MNLASSVLPFFHYNNYFGYSQSGSGLFVYFVYIPLFCLMFLLWTATKKDDPTASYTTRDMQNCLFVFLLFSFVFAVLNYSIRVLDRMELVLIPYYLFFFPLLLDTVKNKKARSQYLLFFLCCLLLRGALVLVDRVNSASGLSGYSFFNPFLA